MKHYYFICLILFGLIGSCNTSSENSTEPYMEVKPITYEDYQVLIENNNDVLYVVNFWSTWCKPCVEEPPDFLAVNSKYESNTGFKMVLVSLDNVKNIDSLVVPFVNENKITTPVYLLDDNKRMNMWIPAIEDGWDGSIPATVFYKNGKKVFFNEGKMSGEELENQINTYL